MIEEPYRWVEAIANRREYIEAQLAPGSPIAALGYRDGILFLTVSQTRQKIFEIYDRIAMGAIGHPGDIERLRMAAIELASTEGFTRAATDVSLRRLVHYSLWATISGAEALCRGRRTTWGGFILTSGVRWGDRDQRRNVRANATGLCRTQRHTAIERTDGSTSRDSARAGCQP